MGYSCSDFVGDFEWEIVIAALEAGGRLIKIADDPRRPSFTGQRGTMIVYYGTSLKERTRGDGATKNERFRFLKRFWVFNTEQCEGLPEKFGAPPAPALELEEGMLRSNEFVAALGANITYGGTQAFYRPSADLIVLP